MLTRGGVYLDRSHPLGYNPLLPASIAEEDPLANTQSAKKRIRQNRKRQVRNKAVRTRTRTYVKHAQMALAKGELEESTVAVHEAVSELDRAASKGVIHRRNADRRKSRMMKRLARLSKDSN